MMLHYKNGINVFEGSWDLPRSFQDLEVFGSTAAPDGTLNRGSIYMTQQKVELRNGRATGSSRSRRCRPNRPTRSPSWWTP